MNVMAGGAVEREVNEVFGLYSWLDSGAIY